MKTEFTKGEWTVETDHSRKAGIYSKTLVFGNGGRLNQPLVADCLNRNLSKDEMEANSKLIAAAPDMIEVLIRVLKDIERDTLTNNTKIMIEQAIKKATE